MAKITDLADDVVGPDGITVIRKGLQWRKDLQLASFRGANFHVEHGSKDSGRRIVVHEFPKKDFPYSEDMGRRAYEFTVRGYCIVFPREMEPGPGYLLYQPDYRIARDALEVELSKGEPGVLQLPTFKPMTVVCPRWRLTEEEKFGGYCTFDMQFVELGLKPMEILPGAQAALTAAAEAARARTISLADRGVP
jgi:prophage DNA circulation protein